MNDRPRFIKGPPPRRSHADMPPRSRDSIETVAGESDGRPFDTPSGVGLSVLMLGESSLADPSLARAALPALDVFVRGIPRTEGSTKLRRGKITHDDPELMHWRGNIYAALLPLWRKADGSKLAPLDGPIRVDLDFFAVIPDRRRYFPTDVLAEDWKAGQPWYFPTHWAATPGRMDVEKLARAVFDGVTSAGVWKDDGLVVELTARKYFAAPPDLPPGVRIRIEAIEYVTDARPPPIATLP